MNIGLATDLYELTMAQSYLEHRKTKPAVFSLFVRDLRNRNFLVSAGLETLIERVYDFKFHEQELHYLDNLGFSQTFLKYLENYRFAGDIFAVQEGRIIFQNEPLIQVEASLPDAQILETLAINTIQLQTLVASKAIRMSLASRGKPLIDFGLRRAHGVEAGLYAARAAYIAGFDSTSNLMAGKQFNIPVTGTMAHSYIEVFNSEEESFQNYAKSFPHKTVFLIDTYDTIKAAHTVAKLCKKDTSSIAIRIDSGNLVLLSKAVRTILDNAGLERIKIIASGGLDEYHIQDFSEHKAPIDIYAIGTMLVTSADQPYLDMAYKLVEYDGKPKVKLSPNKATIPYKRQIRRYYTKDGEMSYDELTRFEKKGTGEQLISKVVENGDLICNLPKLKEIRKILFEDLHALPDILKALKPIDQPYKVEIQK